MTTSHDRIEAYKSSLQSDKGMLQPVLPVLVEGGNWEKENVGTFKYILLSGYSLFQAMCDLAADDRYVYDR